MEELEELKLLAAKCEDCYFGIDDLPEDWELVSEGDWIHEGKYQHEESIVTKNGKYFRIMNSRSGSYHTDWYYDEPQVYEVERIEKIVVTVEWRKKGE